MDPREMDALVQRLVADPHDQTAIAQAHAAGTEDPRSYAVLLERVGTTTADSALASHWLSEAASVWITSLNDPHRAARLLMTAIDKDPLQPTAAERLAELYRQRGETKALAALLERRVKTLTPRIAGQAELGPAVASMHEELGRLWSAPPLATPKKALENFRRAFELDPRAAYAIYGARELYKQLEQWSEAVPLFGMELALVEDKERKIALLRDEAEVRKLAGDRAGVTEALRVARSIDDQDPTLAQSFAWSILERVQAGDPVPEREREDAIAVLVQLAETYGGEHGLAYAGAALDVAAGHDRAMQLLVHFAAETGHAGDLKPRWRAYLDANPAGFLADQARLSLGVRTQPPPAITTPPANIPIANVDEIDRLTDSIREVSPPKEPASIVDVDTIAESVREPDDIPPPPAFAEPAPPPAPVEAPAPARQSSPGRISVPPGAPPVSADALLSMLDQAADLARSGKVDDALAAYREVLARDPANAEALAWAEDTLRRKRRYADLRNVLAQAARAPSLPVETRKQQLREVAGLCESQLRDVDGAIHAWKQIVQIDRGDDAAREQLRRLLKRAARWDEVAGLIEQEATATVDVEAKIVLEKKLALLHENKRKDPIAAGEAWARISALTPEDERPLTTAADLYEKGGRPDLAVEVIETGISSIEGDGRVALLLRVGALREAAGDLASAGRAFVTAAEAGGGFDAWQAAERCFTTAELWDDAAAAVAKQAEIVEDDPSRAALLASEAILLERAGDATSALRRLEQATALDPSQEGYAAEVERRYRETERFSDLATLLLARAARMTDAKQRLATRKEVAQIQRARLGDADAARATLELALGDAEDPDVLGQLVDDAEVRGEAKRATELLARLAAIPGDDASRLALSMREARLMETGLGDVPGAIAKYEQVLSTLDPGSREALARIAHLEERRGNPKGVAGALKRSLVYAADDEEKVEIARRLAELFEGPLKDPTAAMRALDAVLAIDADDFDAVARLEALATETAAWPRVVDLLARLADIEGDPEEASKLVRRRADVMAGQLGRHDEALASLLPLADEADDLAREAYVKLGDAAGKGVDVARKLVAWHGKTKPSVERSAALRGAFDRFVAGGEKADAVKVAIALIDANAADAALVSALEGLAVDRGDRDALARAHRWLEGEAEDRAVELVRQAEVLKRAGAPMDEVMVHGETGLAGLAPADAEPLLVKLGALAAEPAAIVDLYERAILRAKTAEHKLAAYARAAEVAAAHGATDRAKGFFELALAAAPGEEVVGTLLRIATDADAASSSLGLRRTLAEALVAGGHSARDGGRTRAAYLRRAAAIAADQLADRERAFEWLGDALVTHVDAPTLDALESLGAQTGDLARVDATLGRVLAEVFDGPLVRQVLGRRVALRRDKLKDLAGAAQDLKRLHDLAPGDAQLLDDLSKLLTELGDHRGMVQVLEDQILRMKDQEVRASLARKVAVLWDEQIQDAREAADAWRRVLRMKPNDPQAQAGLERAKAASSGRSSVTPKPATSVPKIAVPTRFSAPPAPPAPAAEPPPATPAAAAAPPPAPEPVAPVASPAPLEVAAPAPAASPAPPEVAAPAPMASPAPPVVAAPTPEPAPTSVRTPPPPPPPAIKSATSSPRIPVVPPSRPSAPAPKSSTSASKLPAVPPPPNRPSGGGLPPPPPPANRISAGPPPLPPPGRPSAPPPLPPRKAAGPSTPPVAEELIDVGDAELLEEDDSSPA